jgi:hypothetical protein
MFFYIHHGWDIAVAIGSDAAKHHGCHEKDKEILYHFHRYSNKLMNKN